MTDPLGMLTGHSTLTGPTDTGPAQLGGAPSTPTLSSTRPLRQPDWRGTTSASVR